MLLLSTPTCARGSVLRDAPSAVLKHETSANGLCQLGGERCDLYGIAHVLETGDQAACVGCFGASTEVVCAKVLIEGSVLKHMIEGGENGGGDGADGFLRPASAAQPRYWAS